MIRAGAALAVLGLVGLVFTSIEMKSPQPLMRRIAARNLAFAKAVTVVGVGVVALGLVVALVRVVA